MAAALEGGLKGKTTVDETVANIKQIASHYQHSSVAAYANKLLDHYGQSLGMSQKEIAQQFGGKAVTKVAEPEKKPSKGPLEPEGEAQKQLFNIYVVYPFEKKLDYLTKVAAEGPEKAYAKKLLAELKSGMPEPPQAKPTAATPATPVSLVQQRIQRAKAIEKDAAKFVNVHAAGAAKVIPTLKPDWWKTIPQQGRDAVDAYTGAAYDPINAALRTGDTDEETTNAIAAIDELFEHDDARVTKDVIVRRGENVPADIISQWKTALEKGLPCRYMKTGFISTSLANMPAFSSKNTHFHIVARKGTPALGAFVVGLHGENEVLMRHGQAFEIYDIRQDSGGTTHVSMLSII